MDGAKLLDDFQEDQSFEMPWPAALHQHSQLPPHLTFFESLAEFLLLEFLMDSLYGILSSE